MQKAKPLKLITNERTCKICKIMKPLSEFYKGKDYISHKCEVCFRESERNRQNNLWANNPEHRERHNTKGREHRKKTGWKDKRSGIKNRPDKLRKMGTTYEHVVNVLNCQYGRCGNIGCCKEISLEEKGVTKIRAVIDHDHKTGKFRGVLCSECNMILGIMETKDEKILGLMDYLNKYKNNNK